MEEKSVQITFRKNTQIMYQGVKNIVVHYNNNSDFQAIALDIFIVLPSLILQKPCKHSKAKDHCLKVEERMKLLQEDHILNIIKHCNLI